MKSLAKNCRKILTQNYTRSIQNKQKIKKKDFPHPQTKEELGKKK